MLTKMRRMTMIIISRCKYEADYFLLKPIRHYVHTLFLFLLRYSYQPQINDHGYVCADDDDLCLLTPDPITKDTVAWWRLCCGRVLGVVNGMLLEFDKSTLAPLGLVMSSDELLGKQVAIVESGLEECMINFEAEEGMEGADCADTSKDDYREQVSIPTL